MKHSTPDSMKFKRFQCRLGESKRGTAGLLELLWITAINNARRGDIGKFTNEEIAIECDWEGDPDQLIEALIECGWLDQSNAHRLVIHDWHVHTPKFVKGVLAKSGGFLSLGPAPKSSPLGPAPKGADLSEQPQDSQPLNQTKHNQTKPNKKKDVDPLTDDIVTAWNSEMGSSVRLTPKRRKVITARLTDRWWFEHWAEALSKVRGSPFLMGTNDRGWKADIDFFLQPDTVTKIIEGTCHGQPTSSRNGRGQTPGAREYAAETL